jgi:LysR family transcriptional regulator for bpeEF and oprC
MSASDRMIDMVEEGVDVLIRIGGLPSSNLLGKRLFKTEYVCCASPGFVARHGVPKTPDDLAQFPCLNFIYPKSRKVRPWAFRENGNAIARTPHAAVTMDHVDSLIEAAVAGSGIIQVLSVSVLEQLKSGQLVTFLEEWQTAGPDVSVLFQQKTPSGRQGEGLCRFCRAAL